MRIERGGSGQKCPAGQDEDVPITKYRRYNGVAGADGNVEEKDVFYPLPKQWGIAKSGRVK